MISLDDLRSSVDLYRGCVSFSLPLCSLMGGAGPPFDLAMRYNGNVTYDATTWNMTAPTGVLGLGWSLPIERITVRFDHNTAPADQQIILTTANGSTRLLQTGQVSTDVLTYAAEDYRFWKIQRFLSTERWEITREDGTKFVYGDSRSRRSTVEFGICWGNWIGSSSNLDAQEPIAVAWDLSQIVDLWNNTITFKYQQKLMPVGSANGPTYTQAIYLDEITGSAGDRAAFRYGDKTTDEYQDPHTNPAPPNAWQDRFEKKFLDRIEVFSPTPTSELMYTAKFDFTDGQGHTVFLGSGQMSKRLLMGVKTLYPDAKNDLPAVKFTYVTSASAPAYGSIATVTTPAGGVNTYSYTANQDLDLCDRAKVLAPPSGGTVTYSQPRFWFEDDYVVVTWLGNNQTAQIMAYAWEGRWLESTLGSLAVPTSADYANLQVQTAESNFAVVAGTHALAYHRDVTAPGSWISSDVVALDLAADDRIVTTAGDGFAAVLGQKSGKLNRIRFNGTSWVADIVVLSGGGTAGLQCGMAGKHNFIFSASVLGNDTTDRLQVRIDYLDALTQWQSTSSSFDRSHTALTSLTVYTGDTYAVVVSTAPASGLVQYAYTAFYWSANYDNLQSESLLQLSSASTPAPPELHGPFVGIGQQLSRFDGKTWGQQSIATITYPDQQSVAGISYGFDQVLRTITRNDGNQMFDLIVYNPNQSETATPWSVPSNMGPIISGAGNYTARAALSNDNQSNYVLAPVAGTPSHNGLYYQQPAGAWSQVLQIPDSLTATELGSLQVLDELYCIYQFGTQTIVYPLQNGNALGRISLNEQLIVPSASPTTLIGRQSFVTYTGTWGDPASTLNLRRVVRQEVRNKLQVFAVNTVQQDTGYENVTGAQGRLINAYAFKRDNATIDANAYKAAYNLATAAANTSDVTNAPQGTIATSFFNDLRVNEAPVTPPYPTNPDAQHPFTNATQFLRLLRGKIYATEQKSSTAVRVSSSAVYWFVFTQSLTTGGERGFYKRVQKSDTTLNSVPGTLEIAYDPLIGLPKTITTYQFNSQATKDTMVTNLTYWWEQYDLNRALNILSPVIATIEKTNGDDTAIQVTSWSDTWGFTPARWAPFATYTSTIPAPAAFNKWHPNNDPLPAGWLLQTQVLQRNSRGLLLRSMDVLGREQSAVLDSSGQLPVATFVNADTASREAGYYGFEVYEENVAWSYTGGVSINDFIISGSFHTGSRCLRFASNPAGTVGPISTWLNTNGSRSFVFSCWMLVPSGSNADGTNAFWSMQVETVGATPVAVGPPFKLPFPAARGKWIYIHHLIDLAKYRAKYNPATPVLQITINGVNQSNNFCLVDELRFSAVDGAYSALVYDSSLRRVTATLGENGATMRPVQDVYDRVCAVIGPDENVAGLNIPAFSRMQSAGGNFDPKLPNSVLRINASSNGLYYDFDPSDIPDWTLPANWTIAAGLLTFTGTNSGTTPPFGSPAQLKVPGLTNFAARVRFQPSGAIPFAGIGLDNLCVFWNVSESGWVIDYKKDGNWFGAVIRRVPFGEDWVLAVVDNLVLFYVDGSQVFAYQMTDVSPAGLLTMYLGGPGSFEDLAISVDPQLTLSFSDGAGQFLQELLLVDNQTAVINGVIPDVMRRPQREKNSVMLNVSIVAPPPPPPLAPGPDQSRVVGDVTTYLAGANNQPVATLPDYIALNPPPFAQIAYENSPLGRPVKFAQPGIAIDSTAHVRTIAYAQYVPNGVMAGLGFDSAASINYLLISVTDENGVNSYSLFNVANQLLAQQVDVTPTGQTQKQYNSTKFFYDGAGNLATIQTPNFFAPPAGSQAQDWVITRGFTFLKQIQSLTTPDTGQTQYKYDSVGRLRYILDANGAALNPQRILYMQYDALDRIVETGYMQSATVNWSDIPQYAEFVLPQSATPVWSNRYTYDNNCVDAVDFEACPQADNLIGRLWRVQTNSAPPATPDVEMFVYDRRGRVLIINTAVARYDTNTYQSAFRYNNLDQLIETTYPRPLQNGQPTGAEFKVGRFFDRLGRLVGVGEPPQGNEVFDPRNPIDRSPYAEKYAAFAYDFRNLVTAARFNNNATPVIHRGYAYDIAGRLTQISGDYQNQVLTYETGGFSGAGYFNGQIASSQTTYFAAAGTDRFRAPVVSESRWAYSYDNLGRLLVAANSNQTIDSALNFGGTVPAVYDANGNLLTVPRGAATENYNYQTSPPAPEDANE